MCPPPLHPQTSCGEVCPACPPVILGAPSGGFWPQCPLTPLSWVACCPLVLDPVGISRSSQVLLLCCCLTADWPPFAWFPHCLLLSFSLVILAGLLELSSSLSSQTFGSQQTESPEKPCVNTVSGLHLLEGLTSLTWGRTLVSGLFSPSLSGSNVQGGWKPLLACLVIRLSLGY